MGTAQAPSRVEELRQLAARIQGAVEAYAHGKVADTHEIVRQCQTLQHRAESPETFAERLRYQPLDLCALMIAVEGGMLQALASRGDEEVTADELAEMAKRPKLHIVRTLRLLTAIGVCDEVGVQRYRANDKTPVMASKGQIGGLRVSSVPVCGITTKIEEYFSMLANGAQAADTYPPSAYVYTFGKPMYDVLRENPDRRADFDAYMAARKQEKTRTWHTVYPVISELSLALAPKGKLLDTSEITIVDVGGNRGHDLESFTDSNPGFNGRLVLQDLPETIGPLLADGKKRVFEAMPHDFFTPQPVRGATLYLLLACLHNWEDEACRKILQNLADAMRRGYSRLLISAMLLPEVGAGRRAAELDMQMWVLQQSRQRTRSELEALVHSVGLEVVKVWENGERESIVEVRLPENGTNGLM
ncbi:S-adenosyl-L-methionine-dependent methyltransferase [Achaetomium macrosporum]|uniref:S-adenosyl-L-methionine-dependent methyltransferase n=1 Tax=Achaetomium macrosporum TaxID=79813 RepID=A0AAN7C596_9PEZI|nr:S-adenosyl-L-methionine-dependent methyltransferase [Achaetomium macrosporum]